MGLKPETNIPTGRRRTKGKRPGLSSGNKQSSQPVHHRAVVNAQAGRQQMAGWCVGQGLGLLEYSPIPAPSTETPQDTSFSVTPWVSSTLLGC